MDNKDKTLDIYLMGIGGTGMGALAGLLKSLGHRVRGSDNAVYSPMKEKLQEWGISYKTPYSQENIQNKPDLVIVGNVIRRENPEAELLRALDVPYESFPSALKKIFLQKATSLVACGTHGKTTCSSLLAHTLSHAGLEPGFLIGGIPLNFGESFRASSLEHYPFVVEGDEYDTAYFDKQPKFMHYQPNLLLITSVEFDHADIYADLDAVIDAFARLLSERSENDLIVLNGQDPNIKELLRRAPCKAKLQSYGEGADFEAFDQDFSEEGIAFTVRFKGHDLGRVAVPLYGRHNLMNALGCFAMLYNYGLSLTQIAQGFSCFKGVKRRLEQRYADKDLAMVDDFAHHPTAVLETIKAARQKYPQRKLWAIFEPRSATSCLKIFEENYIDALSGADRVMLAPLGRSLPVEKQIDTQNIASRLRDNGIAATAHSSYESFKEELKTATGGYVLLFMSNGDFGGQVLFTRS